MGRPPSARGRLCGRGKSEARRTEVNLDDIDPNDMNLVALTLIEAALKDDRGHIRPLCRT